MKRASTFPICILILSALAYQSLAQPGSLDITFNPGTGANGFIRCMAVQPDGRIIIGGYFTTFNGSPRVHLARLNTDGSADGTFDSPTSDDIVSNIALQTDGRLLIGGPFDVWNGLPYRGVARLRSDGSLDTGFNPVALGSWDGTISVAGQSDDKVVIGGSFTGVNGTNRNYVARLNSNGSLDPAFNPGAGPNYYVTAVGVQSDGKVIVAGPFTSINGVACSHLARLNLDGTVDTNFTASVAGAGLAVPGTFITVLPDDKFMIGGNITSVNGYSRNGIARLNADGSMDTSFQPGAGAANRPVWAAAVQPDGKVLVGGEFTSFNGFPRNRIARLLANGSVDTTFNPAGGADSNIYAVGAQLDGKGVIGGDFAKFNGTNINRIARLNGDAPSTANPQLLAANRYFGAALYGTVSNTYRIEWTSQFNTPSLWTPLFNVTLQTNPQFIVDPNPAAAGQRFYRAVLLP